MSNLTTLYWHDYETFGANPKHDRPAQFAGLRTDQEFNILGDPLTIYCKPSDDFLPHPEACLITGITPQLALQKGLPETEFIGKILQELAQPATCGVGYNSLRFDDEITRYTLYRNLYDPYAREWQNGNSRWDIIDMVRLTQALRPEGISWPRNDEGHPVFRLEELTKANGISHEAAHDALSDVHATIALAKLIRSAQPRLYDYIFKMRSKREVGQLLNVNQMNPVLHISSRYPAKNNCIAMIAPIARHPVNKNGVIAFDLSANPEPLFELDAAQIRERIFTPAAEMPDGMERLPIKTIHLNRAPVIVPMSTMRPDDADRLGIDPDIGARHLESISQNHELNAKLAEVFRGENFAPDTDVDHMLYGGGFFSDADRQKMNQIHRSTPDQLSHLEPVFEDTRLPEMLFRYRARNYPQTLSSEELNQWREFRLNRLQKGNSVDLSLSDFRSRLEELQLEVADDSSKISILKELDQYATELQISSEEVC